MENLAPGDPQQVGAYRLLARLGVGGMGHVYLARSDRGRTVAVKLVRRELAEQEEFRARFRHEVLAARRVGGYWTAPVLDADTEAEIPWLATGYVAGPSLQAVVGHDHGALPERSVRILGAGLAHALRDIHAAGLIHRDLKPSNILVTIDGPRVIDFGIARALETMTESGLTRAGALVGSPGFMAPEQVRGDRITPACDVFCLGSVLAYAATGALPFGSADSGVHAMMFRIAQEEPGLEGVPEGLADLVRACLRKDPAARPSLGRILELTGAEDTVLDGRSRDPWLPSALVAQLGRHAVRLLDTENPDEGPDPGEPTTRLTPVPAAPAAAPAPAPDLSEAPAAPVPAAPPQASPEHAPAPSEETPNQPAPGRPAPVGNMPTMVAGTDAAMGAGHASPSSAAPHPAAAPLPGYGHPQQHPQPSAYPAQGPHPAYGYPQQHSWSQQPGQYGPTSPYGPGVAPHAPEPEGPRRSGRSTAALIVVALVVALGAGGSVYALMSGDGDDGRDDSKALPTTGASTTPGPTTPEPSATTPSSSSSTQASEDGAVPEGYLGTWSAGIDNDSGHNTRQLVIRQGEVGDNVLALTADGEGYHCVFRAVLTAAPDTGGSLAIGPSEVSVGEPASSCSPGAASEVTLLPDGSLRRVNTGSGEALTYTKSG
ncbi:protein kinase [Streptomyces sp. NPDC050535]|uniref:serine/threonine-protein kinase n=1 Tax=Streptomyces sp. NPDC050535 TaxID=3365626 RepID=UPI0037A1389C